MSALEVAGLSVALRRGGRVLEDVSLEVAPGECLAVVGESGAGKSVLARTLLGLTQEDPAWTMRADTLAISGAEMRRAGRRRWRALRGTAVSLVLQDALQSLDPLRTIGAEVGETLAIRGVRGEARRRAVVRALREAGLPDVERRARQRSTELSGGMRQRALIASALVGDPKLLVADEPTTALDATTAARVLELFGRIRARGTALLLISHDLHSVARVADRVAVLDGGRIVETGPAAALLGDPRHPVTRRLVAAIPRGARPGRPPRPGPPLLELRGAVRRFGAAPDRVAGLDGVDLALRRGEAVGIVGESGAGKTTLARVLVGAERLDAGTLEWSTPPRVRLVPQDPAATFDPRWRVERIVSASLGRAARAAGAPRGGSPAGRTEGAPRTAAEALALVGLGPEFLGRRPATLSGGQRQRVAIARALAARPDVLVCDEPVSALDVSTQAGILALLRELQERHEVAVVLVSHDLAAVRAVCERLVVMREGRVVETGATERVLAAPAHPFTRELLAAAG